VNINIGVLGFADARLAADDLKPSFRYFNVAGSSADIRNHAANV
jgi:hypothetical protein